MGLRRGHSRFLTTFAPGRLWPLAVCSRVANVHWQLPTQWTAQHKRGLDKSLSRASN